MPFVTTGFANSAFGAFSLFSLSTGSFNTAIGAGALDLNTGDNNTATGAAALLLNTTGGGNTANGTSAMVNNSTGAANTAVGAFALNNNTAGSGNTAIGFQALYNNINPMVLAGVANTAVGAGALFSNATGSFNAASGLAALGINTIGFQNTANGAQALDSNTEGNDNAAIGFDALVKNTTGNQNVALGSQAGFQQTTGSNNVYIGFDMEGTAGESNHTYISNINNTTVSGGGTDTVTVNLTTGLLGHLSSSRRYKEGIQPMDSTSETLYRLKPVTYRYKKEIDATQSLDYGLVAEDVAAVDPNLAIRDARGRIESVRYTAVNAMLLNEFLKEHKAFVEEQHKLQKQGETIARLEKQVEALTAGLQKVSGQLATANGAEGMRSDIDGSSRGADLSGSK